jgi:hypothetical protein
MRLVEEFQQAESLVAGVVGVARRELVVDDVIKKGL